MMDGTGKGDVMRANVNRLGCLLVGVAFLVGVPVGAGAAPQGPVKPELVAKIELDVPAFALAMDPDGKRVFVGMNDHSSLGDCQGRNSIRTFDTSTQDMTT